MAQVVLPLDVSVNDQRVDILVGHIEAQAFTEPFFVDTLAQRFGISADHSPNKDTRLVRPLDLAGSRIKLSSQSVTEFVQHAPPLQSERLRFIFHMSRCGSTACTQMLAQSPRFFVLSDAHLIHALLDPALSLPYGCNKELLLKAVIATLAQCAPSEAQWVCIKFRSWNSWLLGDIVRQFPDTPWLFCHRHGAEVMASVLKGPPGWLRARHTYADHIAPLINLQMLRLEQMSDDEYLAANLGAFCNNALRYGSASATYLDYDDIHDRFIDIVSTRWGAALSTDEMQSMRDRALTYSKDIGGKRKFVNDSAQKRAAATPAQLEFINQYVESTRQLLRARD